MVDPSSTPTLSSSVKDNNGGVDVACLFSVDLIQLARQHLEFLKVLHRNEMTRNTRSDESLRRYRNLWLPLVHSNPNTLLIPPADIAWLWHCHRLAPFSYTKYCQTRWGVLLEQSPPFQCQFPNQLVLFSGLANADQETHNMETTRSLWNQKYPEEDFFLEKNKDDEYKMSNKGDARSLLDGLDLISSAKSQATFLWQVSSPIFQSEKFLEHCGLLGYWRFLKLKQVAPKFQVIVPTYPIDLMWHTHILSNMYKYHADCRQIVGETLNHDDSFGDGDRTEGKALDTAFQETKALWEGNYHQDYYAPGGMYRGEVPTDYFSSDFLDWADCPPTGPYLPLVGRQGASSTNNGGAYKLQVVWCWKETPHLVSSHKATDIVSYPKDGWIKYGTGANNKLEAAFQAQGGTGTCDPQVGYRVDFNTMQQSKISSGYERQVQRLVETDNDALQETAPSSSNIAASSSSMIWCWKETDSQMSKHSKTEIFGNVTNCWIKYEDKDTAKLEAKYLSCSGKGNCTLQKSYVVKFSTMKQINQSTGYMRDVLRVDSNDDLSRTDTEGRWIGDAWTDVNGKAPGGYEAFIEATTPSRTTKVNPNPFKKYYIYGIHKGGLGYYHISTKEAHEILYKRMASHVQKVAAEMACANCCGKTKHGSDLEQKLNQYQEAYGIVEARSKVDYPIGMAGLSSSLQRDKSSYGVHYTDRGNWIFPDLYYTAAGGCGAARKGNHNSRWSGGKLLLVYTNLLIHLSHGF